MVYNTTFKGQNNSGTALQLIETTAHIVNSTFVSHTRGMYRECDISDFEYGCYFDKYIGGAIVTTSSRINISQSKFEDNGPGFDEVLIFAEQHNFII